MYIYNKRNEVIQIHLSDIYLNFTKIKNNSSMRKQKKK